LLVVSSFTICTHNQMTKESEAYVTKKYIG
jgi:hypothetical protein